MKAHLSKKVKHKIFVVNQRIKRKNAISSFPDQNIIYPYQIKHKCGYRGRHLCHLCNALNFIYDAINKYFSAAFLN